MSNIFCTIFSILLAPCLTSDYAYPSSSTEICLQVHEPGCKETSPTEEVTGVAQKVRLGSCTSGSGSVSSRNTFVLVSRSGLGKVTEFKHIKSFPGHKLKWKTQSTTCWAAVGQRKDRRECSPAVGRQVRYQTAVPQVVVPQTALPGPSPAVGLGPASSSLLPSQHWLLSCTESQRP